MRITDFQVLREIREEYLRLRQSGTNRTLAEEKISQAYYGEITNGADDDGLLFWIGLADAQYFCKEISEGVAFSALDAIEKLTKSNLPITPGDLLRRKERYSLAPMPEKKQIRVPRKFRCAWRIGDTFAYRLSGSDADACDLSGRFMLLRKVDELEFSDGRLLPVVTFTLWNESQLPKNEVEFMQIPPLKLDNGRLGTPKSHYEYRAELLFTSTQMLKRLPFQFLGNFQNVTMPSDEVIINNAGLITMVLPERLDWHCCIFWKNNNRFKG